MTGRQDVIRDPKTAMRQQAVGVVMLKDWQKATDVGRTTIFEP